MGWHVPSDEEWQTLVDYLGGNHVAGGKMKTTGTIEGGDGLWLGPNTGATNESGFSALPGSCRSDDGSYSGLGGSSYWWSATGRTKSYGWGRGLSHYYSAIWRLDFFNKRCGFSIRCVKH
jgi:uncharacterized protein (TIGR02145 family)